MADLGFTRRYAARLRELGLESVCRRGLGWRLWWGGPWVSTHLVTGVRPPADESAGRRPSPGP